MNRDDEILLEKHGWLVECESPFEISKDTGCFARGEAANIVLESLKINVNTYSYLPNSKMISDFIENEFYLTYGTNGDDNHLIERIVGAKQIIKSLIDE